MFAVVTTVSLLAENAVTVEAITEELATQIDAVKALVEFDMDSNSKTICMLLKKCADELEDGDPSKDTLNSIIFLVENGSANSEIVSLLLDKLIHEENGDQNTKEEYKSQNLLNGAVFDDVDIASLTENCELWDKLPIFEVAEYRPKLVPDNVQLEVPDDWGNNESGERTLVSYSPINGSGAISPKAGTLTISYFQTDMPDAESAFNAYQKSISDMSVTSDMQSANISTAKLSARKLEFVMDVGANRFSCETICFLYESTVYAIELMQGQLTSYNYFPVFDEVVGSTQILGNGETVSDGEEKTEPEPSMEPEGDVKPEEVEPEEDAEPEVTEPEGDAKPEVTESEEDIEALGDISTFMYELNGHEYQFPTMISEMEPDAIPLERTLDLPYDFESDADMDGDAWTEIVNTQYFYFENSFYKEMAGITNLTGYDTVLTEGVLTALIDTQGDTINITLPGGVHVGSSEKEILQGFPQFKTQSMDGTASFIGNEILYACNVRDDGCNGYAIVRNDDPYYSAVTIICENQVVKEISFECIGAVRAEGVFEEQ